MNKSITPIVSVILLVLITIGAGVGAYFFMMSTASNLQGTVNPDLLPGNDRSRLSIISIRGSSAIVKNDGTTPVYDLILFINGEMLNYELDSPIQPGEVREINYAPRLIGESLELKILYNRGREITSVSPPPKNTAESGFVENIDPVVISASIFQNETHILGYCKATVYNSSIESQYNYEWILNSATQSSGSLFGNYDEQNLLLSIAESSDGYWKFRCQISNITYLSSWKESQQILVGEEPEVPESFSFAVNNANAIQKIYGVEGYCNSTGGSADDLLTYEYSWKVNALELFRGFEFNHPVNSMGYAHSCNILANGSAVCWGDNGMGGLGNGSMQWATYSTIPVFVSGGYTFSKLSLGRYNSCGILSNGSGVCWGHDEYGKLGYGGGGNSPVPVFVNGGYNFSQINLAWIHSCGVLTNGSGVCWGYGIDGRLGNGGTSNIPIPVFVKGNYSFKGIYMGIGQVSSTYGLLSNGSLTCWGRNSFGATCGLEPSFVYNNYNFSMLAVGAGVSGYDPHVCGILANGSAVCWGRNNIGQLGNNSYSDSNYPVFVMGGYNFSMISSGGEHSCGVLTNGSTLCWGKGTSGQLGNGQNSNSPIPVFVEGNYKFSNVILGDFHSCGVLTNGSTLCWGLGQYGILGNNGTISSPIPVFLSGEYDFIDNNYYWNKNAFINLLPSKYYIEGQEVSFTCKAINSSQSTSEKTINYVTRSGCDFFPQYCLSYPECESYHGRTTCCSTNIFNNVCECNISECSNYNECSSNYTQSSCCSEGIYEDDCQCSAFSCTNYDDCILYNNQYYCCNAFPTNSACSGYVLTFNASIIQKPNLLEGYCNATGVSISDSIALNYTWKVNGAETVSNIKFSSQFENMGHEHFCMLLENGSAVCWGRGTEGQLGNGAFSTVTDPVFVSGNYNFSYIGGGTYHSCGLLHNGSALCWGTGANGVLGNGSEGISSAVPVFVTGNFSSISVGGYHNCGILLNGSGVCWGNGEYGRLGYNGLSTRTLPTSIYNNYNFSSISAGVDTTCGVLINGSALCWGRGKEGQLGNGAFYESYPFGSLVPVFVSGGYKFSSMSAGYGLHSCGILTNGSIVCFGVNTHGQLGNNSMGGYSSIPVFVKFSSVVPRGLLVTLGERSSCAIIGNNAGYCWGELGSYDTGGYPVYEYRSFSSLGGSYWKVCGVLTNGQVQCSHSYYYGFDETISGTYARNNYYWNKDILVSTLPNNYYSSGQNVTFECFAFNSTSQSLPKTDSKII